MLGSNLNLVGGVETPQKGRLYEISGNPRRVIQFCRRETG
jgi:hypothetical protein